MTLKECYRILKLKENASVDEVKSAYRKRAFELHPDLHPDNPDAARQFQQLNEAYVLLTRTGSGADEGFRTKAQQTYDKAKKGFDASQASQDSQSGPSGTSSGTTSGTASGTASGTGGSSQEQKSRASDAYSKASSQKTGGSAGGARFTSSRQQVRQEDVLNDILKDPFARRVFEDIYSQIRRDSGKQVGIPKKRKLSFEWGDSKLSFDMTHGLAAGVKGWMRKQMDDEQTIHLQPQSLAPGARVRITLSQGMNEEPRQIEITLPPDFVVGRPIRLKGLGRKIGPWTGDLYLRILAKVS
ncbi:MAG: J domain-containing protein [Halodesulfovibrio sp.]